MPADCFELILNHNCDLACGFCSQADFDPALKCGRRDAVRRICAARKSGYRRLGFSGGEALLHEDLPFLIAAARHAGFRTIRLQTNGVRLASRHLCAALAEAGLTVCKFTFLGRNAAVHDFHTGVPGSFAKSLRGLDNMLALKLAAGVNLLVTRRGHRGLKDTLKFFMDRGVSSFVLIYPIYEGSLRRNYRSLGVPMPAASPGVVRALDFAQAAGLGDGVKALNMPPCMLPGHEEKSVDLYRFNTVVASPDGELRDLDRAVQGAKRRGPPCARCAYRGKCRGVDENYLSLFGWKGIAPVRKRGGKHAQRKLKGYLTAMETCFMEILRKESPVRTARMLELAAELPLCHDCRDGAGVLLTGEALMKKGLVARDFEQGSYSWRPL